jgi:hypothetical protein
MTKSAIPNLTSGDAELKLFASSIKNNLDSITGQARNSIALQKLPADATLTQVISQLNALLQRIQ